MGRGVGPRDPIRAEVAVVGGGLAGVSAAYFLARAGLETVLLEARTLGSGATGRGTGLVTTGLGEPYARTVARDGRRRAREIWRFTAGNHRLVRRLVRSLGLPCGYRRTGGLRAALGAGEAAALRRSLPLLRRDGFPAEARAAPGPFREAFWLRGEALIDPAPFVRGLARAAREEGAEVREWTPVRTLRGSPGGLRLQTPRGVLLCDRAIAAGGVGLGRLVPRLALALRPQRSVVQVVRVSRGRTLPPGICRSGAYYWRPLEGSRMAVGGPARRGLDAFVGRIFPGSRREGPGWSGAVDWTRDGFPVVGPVPGEPSVLACAGFCGTGFGYATLAARMCAETAAGRSPRVPEWMRASRW